MYEQHAHVWVYWQMMVCAQVYNVHWVHKMHFHK